MSNKMGLLFNGRSSRNFNDELLALDRELWDYVIVHELLHFFVPNHGKLWKSLMRAHLGDYEESVSRLSSASSTNDLTAIVPEGEIIDSLQCRRGVSACGPS